MSGAASPVVEGHLLQALMMFSLTPRRLAVLCLAVLAAGDARTPPPSVASQHATRDVATAVQDLSLESPGQLAPPLERELDRRTRREPQPIPARLTDQAFWKLVSDFSEEGGFFQSDNFVSNETTYQYVIPELLKNVGQGGTYLGVGPDQNFTYLVALHPRIAFIIDIRRGALLQHLLYKALFEMARDRAEFLSLLFSRPRPTALADTSSAASLFAAYEPELGDSATYWKNLDAIKTRLTKTHGFPLNQDDFAGIEYVYTSFYNAGPEITYNYGAGLRGMGGRGMPTFADLMGEDDGQGKQRSYLATEENFRALKDLESRNLVVPVVGDFAGPKAIRAIGQYLKEHGASVTAIYTSNVEQYLFRGDDWRRYYASVATLPVDSASTFIRAVFNYGGFRGTSMTPGPRSVTLLCPVADFVKAFNEGRVLSYQEVVNCQR
jgi:hypothetical protein